MSIPKPQVHIPGVSASAGKGRLAAFGRGLKRIFIGLIALTLILYLTGRLWEPARGLLAKTPGVGSVFSSPVWQLPSWLRPAPKSTAPAQPEPTKTGGTADLSGLSAELSAKQSQLDLAQQALDQKEKEQKALDQRLTERLQVVETRENQLKKLEANLSQVEIIRAMKPAATTALFAKFSDTEALALLRYMDNDEIAKILGDLDATRAATLFRKLGELKQTPATGS
ncbi:MAG TPA: hypothetical protein VK191_01920 [Symbiobacteriaceae bacterium]|nr:hypothetical protein [Symbiobacteriaceae bacterium]